MSPPLKDKLLELIFADILVLGGALCNSQSSPIREPKPETRNSKPETSQYSSLITHHSVLLITLSLPLYPFPFPPSPFPFPLFLIPSIVRFTAHRFVVYKSQEERPVP